MTQTEDATIGIAGSLGVERVATKAETKAGEVERLAWLDVIRGIAVASTALMHLLEESSDTASRLGRELLSPGIYGIVLFFLVSGFVIPLTLERRGSLRTFVIARVFRLYPLYWFSLLLLMFLVALRIATLDPEFSTFLPGAFWWNVTMVQSWVGQPDAIGLYWTLGFELAFYVASALLFDLRLLGKTDWIVAFGAVYVLVRGIIIPLMGGPYHYFPAEFWALTFPVGTLWYRSWSGNISWRRAATITGLLAATIFASYLVTWVFSGYSQQAPPGYNPRSWIVPHSSLAATGLAYVTFVALVMTGAGSRLRFLKWLGRISYSVYLMHGLLLRIPLPVSRALEFVIRLAVVLPISALTYRFIEAPPIAWGRALTRRLGFSRPKYQANIAPMATASASTDSTATSSAALSPAPAKIAEAPTANAASNNGRLTGILAAAVIAGAGGYFAHEPRAAGDTFVNFDSESTPKDRLGPGWSGFEQLDTGDSFSWCAAKSCTLNLNASKADQFVRVRAYPYTYPSSPAQTIALKVNGTPVGSQTLTGGPTVYRFKVPAATWKDGKNEVQFEFAYAEAPKVHFPTSTDDRTLAAAFDWVDVVPVAPSGK